MSASELVRRFEWAGKKAAHSILVSQDPLKDWFANQVIDGERPATPEEIELFNAAIDGKLQDFAHGIQNQIKFLAGEEVPIEFPSVPEIVTEPTESDPE